MPVTIISPTSDNEYDHRSMANSINKLASVINSTDTVTLAANATTTTITGVTDGYFHESCIPVFVPTTANAAGALSSLYVSTRSKTQIILTHANTATTDRTFLYFIVG